MNIWNRFSRRLTQLALSMTIVSLAGGAFAQGRVSAYIKTTPANVYSTIAGQKGTVTLVSQYGWYYYNTTTMAMPINFPYDNQTVAAGTTVYFYGVNFAIGSNTYPYGTCMGSSSYPGAICPWATYAKVGESSTSTLGNIYSLVTGTAPNRVWTLEWTNVHTYQGTGRSTSYYCSMQVVMYEATGRIQYLYQYPGRSMYGGYNGGVGLNGLTTNGFASLSIQNSQTIPSTNIQLDPPPPPSEFSLQPKTLSFGGLNVGQSATLTTTLTSLGPNAVIVNSATLGGSSDFTILNPLAANTSIPKGSTYTFQIKYQPTNTGGSTSTFTVVTNAKDSSTQIVSLSGSGLAPLVQYTFTPYLGIMYPYNSLFHHVALKFGDTLSQTFYVKNPGQAPLVFNSISMFGLQANMYQITKMPQNPLPAGASDSITVRFQPFLEGRPDAAIAISTNAFNQANDTVTLWGTGKLAHLVITPQTGEIGTSTINGTLRFDSVAIGDSVCKTLALHNTGTDTLYVPRQQVTYGDYDFHFYPLTKPDTMIAPDQTKLVNVCFVPVQAGARFASIRFYTNISKTYPDQRDTSQFLINVSGTGVPYGKLAVSGPINVATLVGVQKCVEDTIWNTGSADLTISSVKLSGANVSDYTMTAPTLPLIIAKGGYQTVQVCFNPAARGLSTATVDIVGSTSGRAQNMSLAINGTGQVGCASATPNPVPFGVTYPDITLVGDNDSAVITVKNCGDVPMTFGAVATPSTYSVTSVPSASVAPNGTTTFTVHFMPTAMGSANGTVTITPSESSVSPIVLPLSGVGGAVTIAASGTPSNTEVGSTSTFTVTLANNGNVAWTPNGATVTGDYTAGTVSPTPIPAGSTGTMTITFAPTQVGPRAGSLTFNNADIVPVGGLPYNFSANGTQGAGVSEITAKDGFSIGTSYPNPASREANVVVTMPHDAKVTVALVRVDGSQVANVFNGSLSQGQHTLNFDVTDVASGTYFYMLESENVRLVRQMVVAK